MPSNPMQCSAADTCAMPRPLEAEEGRSRMPWVAACTAAAQDTVGLRRGQNRSARRQPRPQVNQQKRQAEEQQRLFTLSTRLIPQQADLMHPARKLLLDGSMVVEVENAAATASKQNLSELLMGYSVDLLADIKKYYGTTSQVSH